MTATRSHLDARTANPGEVKPLDFLDLAGDGSGPFAPTHALADAAGALITADNPAPTRDGYNRSFWGAVPMSRGVSYPPARAIRLFATASGNVVLTLTDGSTLIEPVYAGNPVTFNYEVIMWDYPDVGPATIYAARNLK